MEGGKSITKRRLKKIIALFLTAALIISYAFAPVNQVYAASNRLQQVTKLKAVVKSEKKVKLTWKKVKKAKKYEVYVKGKKDKDYKTYKLYKTVKNTNVTVGGLKPNTIYYFKVRAIDGKINGKYSKVVKKRTKKATPTPTPVAKDKPKHAPTILEINLFIYKFSFLLIPLPCGSGMNKTIVFENLYMWRYFGH